MTESVYLENISNTPIGSLALASTHAGLLAVDIGVVDLVSWAARIAPAAAQTRFEAGPVPAAPQLLEYFAGTRQQFDLPLDLSGLRPFQYAVLEAVSSVPYGETCTYAQIADQIGRPGAYRAVGRANATNPLSIVIPCHRLVGADGSLRGYGAPGGIQTKAWLLAFERGTRHRR